MKYNKYINSKLHIVSKDNATSSTDDIYNFEVEIFQIEYSDSCYFIYSTINKINPCKLSDDLKLNSEVLIQPYGILKTELANLEFNEYLNKCNVYLENCNNNDNFPVYLSQYDKISIKLLTNDNSTITSDKWGQ